MFARDSTSELIVGRADVADYVKINNSGQVGIGTSPSNLLHVKGGGTQVKISRDTYNVGLKCSGSADILVIEADEVWLGSAPPFKVGTISSPVSMTGNQSYTGIGFQPQMVEFTLLRTDTGVNINANGCMDHAGNQWTVSSDTNYTKHSTSYCFWWINSGGGKVLQASFVSMDSDGFTLNWTNADTVAHTIGYKAFA